MASACSVKQENILFHWEIISQCKLLLLLFLISPTRKANTLPFNKGVTNENITNGFLDFNVFFKLWVWNIYSNGMLKNGEMKGGDDLHWRVFSTGNSTGIQLSHLIITFLIQPLFMSFLVFLKSSELCLPMLWHIMKHSYAARGRGW